VKSPFSKADTAPAFQMSLEIVMTVINAKTTPKQRYMFAGFALSGSHDQSDQTSALSAAVGASPESARTWIQNGTKCSKEMALYMAVRCKFESEEAMLRALDKQCGLGLFK
jgi:hypothetical protein